MDILDEFLDAVKLIKSFAWEDRWTQRTMDARKKELSWIVKLHINRVLSFAAGTLTPILVSVISFASYIWVGNQLTASVAFTAISLFPMVCAPLKDLPAWIVFMRQAKVNLDYIQEYIDGDEVDGQVSSLKENIEGHGNKERLGIIGGSFKWNAVEETISKATLERRFKLRDISVFFPDGQLTVITGAVCPPAYFFMMFAHLYHRTHG